MAEFPALPLWTDAYLGDTTHLTTIEHGAYLLLLMTAWRSRDTRLPDDDRLLARYARCTIGQWKRLRPIMEPFFSIKNGFWTQSRLTDEAVAVRQKREKAAQNGRASALKRKGRHATGREQSASEATNETPTDGQLNHNHTHLSDTIVSGADGAGSEDPDKVFWANAKAMLQPHCRGDAGRIVGQWLRDNGKELTVGAITAAQLERAVNPIEYCQGYFRRHRSGKAAKPEPGSVEANAAYCRKVADDQRREREWRERQASQPQSAKGKAFEERQAAAGGAA